MARRFFLFSALLIFLAMAAAACSAASTGPLSGSERPAMTLQTSNPALAPTQMPTQAPAQAPTPMPAITEARTLFMEWPPTIRVGDSRRIHLALQLDEEGRLTPTVSQAGNVSRGVPLQIPNLYETHNVVVEARFDIVGLQVSPQGEILEPMQPGQSVNFYWSVQPQDVGTYQGTIWLHLHFIPRQGGAEQRIPLTAQPIEIQAINFLGLGGTLARILGGVGTLLGSVLGLDNVVSWLWGRLKKRAVARASNVKAND
jgi:hypothetical protein